MSDLELLYLILALLYVWECLCWLPRGSVAFTTWLGRRWRIARPSTSFGNQNGGFVLASPLPPLGTIFTAAQLPVSLSPEGILVFVATQVNPGWRPAQSGKYIPFTDVRDVRAVNKKVLINGEVVLKCASSPAAGLLAGSLGLLARLPHEKRAVAIDELVRDRLDLDVGKNRATGHRLHFRWLRWAVNLLFVYLFVTLPVVITQWGFKRTWLWLLLGLLAFTVSIATLFWRAHRKLYPPEEDDRFTHTLTAALSPAAATRAHDTLSRPLFHPFHPLVPAKLFLDAAAFREFASFVLRDVRHPMLPVSPSDDPAIQAVELHARTVLRRNLEAFVQRAGLSPDELCQPPKPSDDTCRAYCPRCHSQFTTMDGTCADCGGLALAAFA